MTQFTRRYYPTICIRRAEMKAMEKLPETEKEKMLPVVLLAPWLNSINFENTFRIIAKSIGNIPIIVDIDRHFQSSSELPSREYFREISDVTTGPEKWMKLVAEHDNYIPCIQIANVHPDVIRKQVSVAKSLARGFAIRIELQKGGSVEDLLEIVSENLDQDILIIIDYGYKVSSEIAESNVSILMDKFLSISNDLKFVISGSNFPNAFSDYDDFASSETIFSRVIYSNLSQKYGNYSFFYGDWASTKPRSYDGGGSTPLPRVDFPTANRWIIARSKENAWDFQKAAEMITRLPEWQSRPMVWGTGVIEKAAKSLPGGISTGPQAIAARVNVHLYLQNNFGTSVPNAAPKGKWIDPL